MAQPAASRSKTPRRGWREWAWRELDRRLPNLTRRHRFERLPITLNQRRIYIVPSRFGLFFAVGLAMGLSNALLIRRAVMEGMLDALPDLVFRPDPLERQTHGVGEIEPAFFCPLIEPENQALLSDDYAFCRRVRDDTAQSIRSYAGIVRNSTNVSLFTRSEKIFAASSYLPSA